MTRINLLPWREMRRKELQRQFVTAAVVAVIAMGLVVLAGHLLVGGQINAQQARNNFLKNEIAQVDKKIAEIKELESEKSSLLARMNIIQKLQSRRPEIVHLFYELMRNVPSGIYLTSVEQKGSELIINGIAQSNARISALMRNLELTEIMEAPRLEVIKASKSDKESERTSQFTLHVKQVEQHESQS